MRVNSYQHNLESISIVVENMEDCYVNAECAFQVFIDTDNNANTGFYGANYRITGYNGEIYAAKHISDGHL